MDAKIIEVMVPALDGGRGKNPALILYAQSHRIVNNPHCYTDLMVREGWEGHLDLPDPNDLSVPFPLCFTTPDLAGRLRNKSSQFGERELQYLENPQCDCHFRYMA